MNRREFLGASALGAASLLLPRTARAGKPARPRAFIQLYNYGGIDAIYTTNPRLRAEVEAKIDVPFEEAAIRTIGGMRIGPLLQPLERYLPRMALLNSVYGATVAHETGELQIHQMRRTFPAQPAIGLAGTLGRVISRDLPLDDVRFLWHEKPRIWNPPAGRSLVLPYYLAAGDEGLLARLNRLVRDGGKRDAVLKAAHAELARCGSVDECGPMRTTAALIERMPIEALPPPSEQPGPPEPFYFDPTGRAFVWKRWASLCRDVAYLLSRRLTASIYVQVPQLPFDAHYDNAKMQRTGMGWFNPAFLLLMEALEHATTPDGTRVADETGIVIASELGRFPVLNALSGKDHFPEFPVMMMGPGLRPGQHGETDRTMSAVPISFATGKPGGSAAHAVASIDDLGATLLQWFGVTDTRSRGYLGNTLEFLFS